MFFYTAQLLFLLFMFTNAQAIPYAPCPILGPRFPVPTNLPASKTIQQALVNLTKAYDELVRTGGDDFTATTPNTTSFSVVLFAANSTGNLSQPFFYEYHHTAPSLTNSTVGVRSVGSNSIYNIGGLAHIMTAYAFLVAAGEKYWYDTVGQHIPELASGDPGAANGSMWSDIRLIDLASYLAGIPRTDAWDSLDRDTLSQGLAHFLPPLNNTYGNGSVTTTKGFLDVMRFKSPIYLPGTTPIYSDASYQLLTLAVERIAGKPFGQVLTDGILNPLNLSSTSLGTPQSTQNGVIPNNISSSGWQVPQQDSFLLSASSMFSSVHDLATIGQSILRSTLLSPSTTRRWFKPHSHTSNLVDDVGAPWTIYKATLDGTAIGAVVPAYTKSGSSGLYSPYFGIVPDYEVGFAILSADTDRAADLNAHADYISSIMGRALEVTAIEQAAVNFAGRYTGVSSSTTTSSSSSNITLTVRVDKLSGLSITNWTSTTTTTNPNTNTSNTTTTTDLRASYAQLASLPPSTLDFRLYPSNIHLPNHLSTSPSKNTTTTTSTFHAVLQDRNAPIDAGTPTCTTWSDSGLNGMTWNGVALDEFVFEVDGTGRAVGVGVPALEMWLVRV